MEVKNVMIHEKSCKKLWRNTIMLGVWTIVFFLVVENTVPPQLTMSYFNFSHLSISEIKEKLEANKEEMNEREVKEFIGHKELNMLSQLMLIEPMEETLKIKRRERWLIVLEITSGFFGLCTLIFCIKAIRCKYFNSLK